MSPLRVTVRRTVGLARYAYSTALVFGGFLAATAAIFAANLDHAEGGRLSAAVIWAVSVSPVLPLLAAFLGMDTWSEERRTGMLDVLLASPVSELHLTLGKLMGTWLLSLVALGLSLVGSVALLGYFAPDCDLGVLPFVLAFVTLAMQCALWCAVSVAASAIFRRPSLAAVVTAVILVAIPRAVWSALLAWSPSGRPAYGEFPLDAQVIDFASGFVSGGTVLSYAVLTVFVTFVAVTCVANRRLVGRGSAGRRFASLVSMLLGGMLAALAVSLALRLGWSFELSAADDRHRSERTVGILAEAHGDVDVICFLSRNDARFRPLLRSLRSLSRAATSVGGAHLNVRCVDPAWDIGEASRLVREGVRPGTVRFVHGRRTATISADDALSERACASTVLRLTAPPQRRSIRWTRGHGESAFDDYGDFGMSDIARELNRDGYQNQVIDLTSESTIPADCALIVIAGASREFSRAESARLDAYLKQGGRLLALINSGDVGGVLPLLSAWGVNVAPLVGERRTISGSDVIVTDFGEHPVTVPLKGTRLVFEHPLAFAPSAAVGTTGAADRIGFTPLATVGSESVAAVVERGAGAGRDLALRPTRIVVIGDSAFIMNSVLATHANANRDFFLNAVAYLSGTDAMTFGGVDADLFVTGMDRASRRRLALVGVAGLPVLVALCLLTVAIRRRHRK